MLPVRSRSIDKHHSTAYLSTACRLKIPPPIGRHYRPTIDLRSNREKHEIPSFARAEGLRAREVDPIPSKKVYSSYEHDLHIETTVSPTRRTPRVQRKFENELKRSFYRVRACETVAIAVW